MGMGMGLEEALLDEEMDGLLTGRWMKGGWSVDCVTARGAWGIVEWCG